ncbi:Serine/threonine phosphatase stp [Rubripirellula tenax]|uniref:Serine/threonine phosphatase stp n=1 Tax=Rubripirellula tenax TaxID=2528015 RepID=A0A5C6ERT0_9BACT|nr:protein phosphatase 2C domain-containing protein [Rubripirellula tenax]TWU51030.1 Serine/threonine phosphatase stp [Rubripirellula tenax]
MNNPSDSGDAGFFSGEEELSASGATDCGRVRETNQDQFLIAQLNKSMRVGSNSLGMEKRVFGSVQGEVLLVADGMGGHAAGEKASQLAIEHLVRRLLSSVHWHFQSETEKEEAFIADLQDLLKDAHTRILLESTRFEDQRGMGTTLTMAYLIWPQLYVVHAGDSRCYLIRNGVADPLTTDHTIARQMVDAGGLKPEDEATSKYSNVLWNVLGGRTSGDLIAEVKRVDLEPGDKIVLCSDGLHRYVRSDALAQVVSENDNPQDACRRLIELANEAGGEDNITVVVSSPAFEDLGKSTWVDFYDTTIPGRDTASFDSSTTTEGTKPKPGDVDPLADTWPG